MLFLLAAHERHSGTLAPFTPAGQGVAAAVAALAAGLLYLLRDRFDARPAGPWGAA